MGLSADEEDDLNKLTQTIGVHGDRCNAEHMAYINR